jgi:hypothetical protein
MGLGLGFGVLVWAVLSSLFADPFKKNKFLASEFIVAD